VQLESMKPKLKAPGTKRLKLKYIDLLSSCAFIFNLRRYTKGVHWDKSVGKWRAQLKRKFLGNHATEEAAVLAYDNYVKNGVDPVTRRGSTSTSQFKGVSWHKGQGKWRARCQGKELGYHAMEEAAARAYNREAERIGRVDLNVIPPAGDVENGGNTAAAPALLGLAAPAHAHAGAGSKRSQRVSAVPLSAPPLRKKMRLDPSAGAAAGARAAAAEAMSQGQHPLVASR